MTDRLWTSGEPLVEIAGARESDLEAIARLHTHFWGEVSDAGEMAETLVKLEADPDHTILVARIDGECVGTATGAVCHGLYGGSDSYLVIEDVVVDPEHRRRGVATALLCGLEAFARERSCNQMILLTESVREDAIALYESAGFDARWTGFKKKLHRGSRIGDITIRVASIDERDRVFSLLKSAAVWLRERDIDYWQNWHDPPAHHIEWVDEGLRAGEFMMVESGGSVIGCLRVQERDELFWGTQPESARYIHSFTIDRKLAGRSIGRSVIEELETWAAVQGVEVLRLDCGFDITGLRDYYESCGFVAVGEVIVDEERLVLYEKQVTARDHESRLRKTSG